MSDNNTMAPRDTQDQFLDKLGKHLLETVERQRASSPKMVAEARAWYKRFTGANGTPISDNEVVELYSLLNFEVDN